LEEVGKMCNRFKLSKLMPVADSVVAAWCQQTSCPDVDFCDIVQIRILRKHILWSVIGWVNQNKFHNALLIVVKNRWKSVAILVCPPIGVDTFVCTYDRTSWI